jgi:hypothetical protein
MKKPMTMRAVSLSSATLSLVLLAGCTEATSDGEEGLASETAGSAGASATGTAGTTTSPVGTGGGAGTGVSVGAGTGGSGGAGGSGAISMGGHGGSSAGAGGAISMGGNGGGAGSAPSKCGGIAIPMGTGNPSGGTVGAWADVTPAGIDLTSGHFNGDNFGAQDVLVDPARPSDLYAFFCHQGVYKSTDYGQTWAKVNTGTNGAKIDSGKPWGEGIDSNRCRDPNTPPTLYSAGSQNQFWRSIDGGVNWTGHDLPNDGKARPNDVYDVDVDPYDGKHLIVGFHEESGLAESTDGGDTWKAITLAGGMSAGTSWYPFFIDTGDVATTRTTWLMLTQVTGSGVGTWRTVDAGKSWNQVEKNEHQHGGTQLFQNQGAVYMAGVYSAQGWGVLRSTDHGATWTHVGSGGSQSVVYGTAKYVYAQAAPFGDQSQAERAPLPGTTWSTWPLTMKDGPKRAAVSNDGSHNIIVGGNWMAGIWRYVEP